MTKEHEFINTILRKLNFNEPLTEYEIQCVRQALMCQHGYKQEPYFEVIYHDEYDNTQSRVMNPVNTFYSGHKNENGLLIRTDTFEVGFSRIIREGEC